MRVLVIKTSSLGDVIHTLPAITEATNAIPGIEFDWVVEDAFVEIPSWHKSVKTIIPISLRRWRKNLFKLETYRHVSIFLAQLRRKKYDIIIDAQGLLKSALLARLARGVSYGMDKQAVREHVASYFYDKRIRITPRKQQHAVTRLRHLFAEILGYQAIEEYYDYGLEVPKLKNDIFEKPYVVFLHGTAWTTKQWPINYWRSMANHAQSADLNVKLLWNNLKEKQRAEAIAKNQINVEVLPKLTLRQIASLLKQAKGAVAVDTGLGHLAAALQVPTLSLYGPTSPELTGTYGSNQRHVTMRFECAPCFSRTCFYKSKSNYTEKPPCFSVYRPEKIGQFFDELLKISEKHDE